MLVLSRKPGESIVMSGGIEVLVCRIDGDKVRLGISAPQTITVDRKEVAERKLEDFYREEGNNDA